MDFEKISCAEAGSASSCVLDFMRDIKDVCMHSFIMLRHGKVFAEMGYRDITPKTPQRLYSVSKTFAGAAIGMLIYEGKLSLDDRIAELFGRESEYEWINDMTLRDCLRMATCHDGTTYKVTDKDWVETFFTKKPSHPSGTVFHYDTSAAHVMGALVERITGMRLMEYLKEKIGLSDGVDCVSSPEGYSWAGSGCIADLYDMAKLAMLYMNGGVINGKRVMSEEYAREAASKQIDNDSGFNHRWKDGYGYQIWLTDYGYVFYGMGSQDVVCIPDKDFVFVCTADTMGENIHGKILEDALLRNIVNKLDTGIEDKAEDIAALSSMRPDFPKPVGIEKHLDGKGKYLLEDNPMGINDIEVDYENGVLLYNTDRGEKRLCFGKECYVDSEFPETHYFGDRIGVSAEHGYRCCAAGAWVEENKLQIKVWILDKHTGGVNITIVYKGDELALCMRKHGEWYLDEYSGFAGGKKID